MMDEKRMEAYRFIGHRALYELRLFSAPYLQGPPLFAGFRRRHRRRIKFIANFAYAYHNLALAQTQQRLESFDEELFWNGIDSLQKEFTDLMLTNYRELFERTLNPTPFSPEKINDEK